MACGIHPVALRAMEECARTIDEHDWLDEQLLARLEDINLHPDVYWQVVFSLFGGVFDRSARIDRDVPMLVSFLNHFGLIPAASHRPHPFAEREDVWALYWKYRFNETFYSARLADAEDIHGRHNQIPATYRAILLEQGIRAYPLAKDPEKVSVSSQAMFNYLLAQADLYKDIVARLAAGPDYPDYIEGIQLAPNVVFTVRLAFGLTVFNEFLMKLIYLDDRAKDLQVGVSNSHAIFRQFLNTRQELYPQMYNRAIVAMFRSSATFAAHRPQGQLWNVFVQYLIHLELYERHWPRQMTIIDNRRNRNDYNLQQLYNLKVVPPLEGEEFDLLAAWHSYLYRNMLISQLDGVNATNGELFEQFARTMIRETVQQVPTDLVTVVRQKILWALVMVRNMERWLPPEMQMDNQVPDGDEHEDEDDDEPQVRQHQKNQRPSNVMMTNQRGRGGGRENRGARGGRGNGAKRRMDSEAPNGRKNLLLGGTNNSNSNHQTMVQ